MDKLYHRKYNNFPFKCSIFTDIKSKVSMLAKEEGARQFFPPLHKKSVLPQCGVIYSRKNIISRKSCSHLEWRFIWRYQYASHFQQNTSLRNSRMGYTFLLLMRTRIILQIANMSHEKSFIILKKFTQKSNKNVNLF